MPWPGLNFLSILSNPDAIVERIQSLATTSDTSLDVDPNDIYALTSKGDELQSLGRVDYMRLMNIMIKLCL